MLPQRTDDDQVPSSKKYGNDQSPGKYQETVIDEYGTLSFNEKGKDRGPSNDRPSVDGIGLIKCLQKFLALSRPII